jgi:hypothetical protein
MINDFIEHKKTVVKKTGISKAKVDLSLRYFEKALKKTIRNKKPFSVYGKVTFIKLHKK